MKKQTQAIHLEYERRDAYDSLSVPVYNTLAYEFDNAAVKAEAFTDKIKAPDYSRVENPTVTNLERRVAALTDAAHATAFNSGMAAISNTFMSLAAQGKNIVTSKHLFGNTYALLVATLRRFGVKVRLRDLTNIEEVREAIDDDTCCVFLEILTNPQLEVADLKAISEVAHEKNVPLVVDSTVIPFTQFSAKNLGVDIEVVSSSKYVSGGATSLGGLVIDYGTPYNGDFAKRLYGEMLFNFGAYMTPQVAYMQTIGLETLDARYRVQSSNALELAKKLRTLPQIQYVNYVGLEDNPYHELAQRQFGKTAGAMICIDLESKEACFNFLNNLKLIHRATNLFDNRSLAIHPASTIFGAFSENMRKSMDVKDTTIRLSVGLEDMDDLFEDIKQAVDNL
ncbi:PLP-dependent aspartate aminotransferase family protein [Prevotella copri]|uniref:PLP-dependent aspartate aminotransferase family protein n=1 Tax=Segatella copri TaxID=165179 RepID=A0AAW5IKJ5_9BACT|nr:PLP-dependent aspartate aminotransferase family protein [Segatella copri]MCP9534450.1 PLP-dependent aspartate aminotransferase family protein [Segatella copri]MCP9537387.1 PLP-dependent aspartate aminotransferase family protein [Segatella copri]MCP9540385.1 PLP-dependent aspartate aminotransferase family protein [Segatella copri]MCP9559412.1 PLP-dependent aspartate aminotransferase family protein [Segatella copri]MCP9562265.1 PLP-dependent aspartate aminotransferase family protein [Segatell